MTQWCYNSANIRSTYMVCTFEATQLSICKLSTIFTALSPVINHRDNFAHKTAIFSHLHPTRPLRMPLLFLSPHSLPSLTNLLLKPTISNWPTVR